MIVGECDEFCEAAGEVIVKRGVVVEGQREFGGAEREVNLRVVRQAELESGVEAGHVGEGAVALVAEDVGLAVHAGSLARGCCSRQRGMFRLCSGNVPAGFFRCYPGRLLIFFVFRT